MSKLFFGKMQYVDQVNNKRYETNDKKLFGDKFSKDVDAANTKFNSAIEQIDKAITNLQKVKDNLLGSEKKLLDANNKAQEWIDVFYLI